MTTRYVGVGGNNGNTGLSWAQRKLTLNGVEDTPVVAGDTVYVGPGVYRELLTVDVSGTSGNPITYIGDYTGVNTDGVGGVVRITGSDNDQTATRANCITATTKDYRTFQGFSFDTTTNIGLNLTTVNNWIIEQCYFQGIASHVIQVSGVCTNNTTRRCYFGPSHANTNAIAYTHSATVDNTASVVESCIFSGGHANSNGVIVVSRIGGIVIRNSVLVNGSVGIRVLVTPAAGQTITVNNCIITGFATALRGATLGDLVENYNTLFANATDRTTVNTGANSVAYPPLFDPRWFFQLLNVSASQQLITPFDLASFSQLVNLAGTSPPSTDLRGTAIQGAAREIGPLEYLSTLKIVGGGGGISRSRILGGG